MADAERWAAGIPGPAYAIDDETAIKVTDGTVEVVRGALEAFYALSTSSSAVGGNRNSVVTGRTLGCASVQGCSLIR
jgi:hypothetical protein